MEILSWALIKLGAERVTNPDDPSAGARAASEVYDHVRRAQLRRSRWKFAIRTAALPAALPPPQHRWAARFPLPADCLRLLQVGDDELEQPDYALEADGVLADEASPLLIRYVRDEDNASRFDALFAQALACAIAAEIAERVTQSADKGRLVRDDLERTLREAKRQAAIERPPLPRAEQEPYVEVRRGTERGRVWPPQ